MSRKSTVPRYAPKLRHPSLVDPTNFVRTYLPGIRMPGRFLIVWKPGLAPRLARRIRGRQISGLSGTYAPREPLASVGVSYPRGVGGPATIVRAEELAGLGTTEFKGIGFAGSLSPDLGPGDVVVCTGAIRDEGTSHHYAHAGVRATPSPPLRRWVAETLSEADIPFRTGRSWTTDAPYRETRPELVHYRGLGVLTVEMEASALFIFGRHRGVHTASVFVISDVLSEVGWTPHFHRVGGMLEKVAATILAASLKRPRIDSSSQRAAPAHPRSARAMTSRER